MLCGVESDFEVIDFGELSIEFRIKDTKTLQCIENTKTTKIQHKLPSNIKKEVPKKLS